MVRIFTVCSMVFMADWMLIVLRMLVVSFFVSENENLAIRFLLFMFRSLVMTDSLMLNWSMRCCHSFMNGCRHHWVSFNMAMGCSMLCN